VIVCHFLGNRRGIKSYLDLLSSHKGSAIGFSSKKSNVSVVSKLNNVIAWMLEQPMQLWHFSTCVGLRQWTWG